MGFFLHYTILTNILCLFLPLISILKYYKIIGKKATSLESLQYILYHWQKYTVDFPMMLPFYQQKKNHDFPSLILNMQM
jgi:hypothetical protein